MSKDQNKKITFFSTDPIDCPVCLSSFYREELMTGSGRLIAGQLTDELRRLYEPNKKFGELFPLIYTIWVCPSCYYAAYQKDFSLGDDNLLDVLKDEGEKRKTAVAMILTGLDFKEPRDLREGAASYFLALMCYQHHKKDVSPTIKCGISCMRAAWLLQDLHRRKPDENYDYLSRIFFRKARFYYQLAIEKETSGKETMNQMSHLGPDLDKNYGYDGVLYLAGLLEYKYGPKKNPEQRIKNLDRAKTVIARVHGMGKASKQRPSVILERTKDLFSYINEEVKTLKGEEPSA